VRRRVRQVYRGAWKTQCLSQACAAAAGTADKCRMTRHQRPNKKSPVGCAVSRVLFPVGTGHPAGTKAICLDPALLRGSPGSTGETPVPPGSSLPAAWGVNHARPSSPKLRRAGRCLALHPVGFAVPVSLTADRGALLPHLFTLTLLRQGYGGRYVFCGTFPIRLARSRAPGAADGGRYPPPRFSGARTFLPRLRAGAAFHASDRESLYRTRPGSATHRPSLGALRFWWCAS